MRHQDQLSGVSRMFELEDYYYFMLQEHALEQKELYGKLFPVRQGITRTIRKYLSADTQPPEQQHRNKPSKLDSIQGLSPKTTNQLCNSSGRDPTLDCTVKRTLLGDYLRPHPVPLPEWRYETKPGEKAQIDWVDCRYTLSTGSIRKISCFTMILGYSRMRYVEFTRSTDLVTFLLCLRKAFEYFEGFTEQILFDNIKTVVLKRNILQVNQISPGFYGLQ
jgi:transposase